MTALAKYFVENAIITRFERSTMGLPSEREYHIYCITDAWFNVWMLEFGWLLRDDLFMGKLSIDIPQYKE